MTTTSWSGAPPPPFEPPASLRVERPADAAVMGACLVAAVGADLVLRAGRPGLGAVGLAVSVGVGLLATHRFPNTQARALLVLAPLVTAFLGARTSGAAVVPDVIAAAVLAGLAAGVARAGSLFDLTFPAVAGRLALTATHGLLGPAFLARPLGRRLARRRGTAALVRGLAIGLPLVVVLTALLASADAVFASLLHFPGPDTIGLHVVLLGLGAGVIAALLRQASASTAELPLGDAPTLGRVEARMVLGGLCGVFAAFAASQVAVAAGAGQRILSQEGVTYAEYARRGFFQLLAAAGLTAVVLLCVRACGPTADRAVTALILAAVVLTEVVVALAVHRLFLYEAAYGLTLLRLAATAGAIFIGIAFLLIGAAATGVGRRRSWLPGAMGVLGLVGLLAWNMANPAALVAGRNLTRTEVDPLYLASLGDDAVPTIAVHLSGLDPVTQAQLTGLVCAAAPPRRPGPLAWNRSSARAAAARRALGC